jgi:hypothetical protein
MANRVQTLYTTIASGTQVSGTVPLIGGRLFGLWVPVITSAQVFLRGSFDATSANFLRLTNPAGSGDWTFAAGPGSKAVTLQDPAFPFPYLRIETSVAQTDVRTLVVVVKEA